jgi:hypothetical protein
VLEDPTVSDAMKNSETLRPGENESEALGYA